MTDTEAYELVVTPPATRALQGRLPEPVAAAVIEFLTGALIAQPHRVGKPLRGDLSGVHSARRGTYRVLYRINDATHEVVVGRIDHRRVPGDHAPVHDPDLHREAGALLRRLHGAAPSRPAPEGFYEWLSLRLERPLAADPGMLSDAEAHFVREQKARLQELGPLDLVPCHGDYRPYNWLRDDAGTVRVLDFGGARRHFWVSEFTWLHLGAWWERPDLADAFLGGYGVAPTPAEQRLLELNAAVQVALDMAYGRRHGLEHVQRRSGNQLAALMDGRSVTQGAPPERRRIPGTRTARRLAALLG